MNGLHSFERHADDDDSPFYCSPGLTPERTWNASIERLAATLEAVSHKYSSDNPVDLSVELLCSWHRELFGDLFPQDGGRLRWRDAGGWEHVYFGANVGTRRSLRIAQLRGLHPTRLPRKLTDICHDANAERALVAGAQAPSIVDAAHIAAKFYAKLLRARPWVDGNLRASFVGLSAILSSLDLPLIEFEDLDRHDDMLGIAFRGDNEPYRQLTALIVEIIRSAEHS